MWTNNIKLKSKSKTKKDYHYNPEASNHGLCKDLRFTQRKNLELRVMTFFSFCIVFQYNISETYQKSLWLHEGIKINQEKKDLVCCLPF